MNGFTMDGTCSASPATDIPVLAPRDFLVRGLLAGLIAGFLAFGVAYAVGEPSLAKAISMEDAGAAHGSRAAATMSSASSMPGMAQVPVTAAGTQVPRSLQSTLGLLTATAAIGTVLGAMAGICTALAFGRFGQVSPRATTLAVAATGFVALYAVPYLIYPPNPPGVGSPDTIGDRTRLYFTMVLISAAGAVVATLVIQVLRDRIGAWYAALVGVGGYLAAMVLALMFMPRYDEVGAGFPAQLLFEFRMGSLLTQAALWTTIGVVLAELVHRLVSPGAFVSASVAGSRAV